MREPEGGREAAASALRPTLAFESIRRQPESGRSVGYWVSRRRADRAAVRRLSRPDGGIHLGLMWGGAGSFVLFALALGFLIAYRRGALASDGRFARSMKRLPDRLSDPAYRLATGFAEGIAWPGEAWRGAGILLASLAIKLIAATHFL